MIASVHHGRARCRRAVLAIAFAGVGCYSESPLEDAGDPTADSSDTALDTSGPATSTQISIGPGDSSGDDDSTGVADTSETLVADSGIGETEATEESTGASDASSGGDDDESSSGDESSTGQTILDVESLVPGDLVITEVMWNPNCSGDSCEWIEILNTTAFTVDLLDLYIRDIDDTPINQGRITTNLLVEAGGLTLIARGIGGWPYDVDAEGVYGPNPGINNGDPDLVSISNGAGLLDEIPTVPFDQPQGIAWALSASVQDSVSNDNALNWCLATDVLEADGSTEYGTPLVTNPECG